MKLILFAVLVSSVTFAAPKAGGPIFTLKMDYGEKTSQFRVTQEKKKFFATMLTDSAEKKRELKKDDVDYILEKLKTEKPRSEGPCPRMEIQAAVMSGGKTSQYSACLNSGSALSKKLTDLANLLSTAI